MSRLRFPTSPRKAEKLSTRRLTVRAISPRRIVACLIVLAAFSLYLASVVSASLIAVAPAGATVLDLNSGAASSGSTIFTAGPKQVGTPIGENIVFTSTNSFAVINYNGGYGLNTNGSWSGGGRGGYAGG